MLDLHFHSTASDGARTTAEILTLANPGDILTCTDHDIVNDEFIRLAREKGIQTCESVEISAYDPETPDRIQLHVTYYARRVNDTLRQELETMRGYKVQRIQMSLQKLQSHGIAVDMDEFDARYENLGFDKSNLNNSHIAEYIFSHPENASIIENLVGERLSAWDFVTHCLKHSGKYAWVGVGEKDLRDHCNMNIRTIIAHAKNDWAVASLAHPNYSLKTLARYRELVPKYLHMGLPSIEINTAATQEWIDEILASQKQYWHLLTFGSDCHFEENWDDGKHHGLGEMNPLLDTTFLSSEVHTSLWHILS